MNEKEEQILEEILEFYKENKLMPTRRYLQNKFGFKSINSITQYINSLLKQNYLIRNKDGKIILNNYTTEFNKLKTIKVINNNEYLYITLNKNKKYIGFKIHNDYFKDNGILRNDILIIEPKKELKENDLGLFIVNNKYRVMKYNYKDGFYLLKDNEELLLNRVKIIGKVIMIERKL